MRNLIATTTLAIFSPFLFTVNVQAIVEPEEKAKEVTIEKKPAKVTSPKEEKYTVVAGDTLSGIAEKFNINWIRLWQKNEQIKNQDQIDIGDVLVIPNGKEKLADRALVAPVSPPTPKVVQTPLSTPKAPQRGYGGVNGYVPGWCTWWVKEKRPDIGGYWGNAGYSWLSTARASGFSTGSVPRAGAIGVTAGHVVYVESVSGNMVNISEMGWGYQANTTAHYRSVPASSFTYIY